MFFIVLLLKTVICTTKKPKDGALKYQCMHCYVVLGNHVYKLWVSILCGTLQLSIKYLALFNFNAVLLKIICIYVRSITIAALFFRYCNFSLFAIKDVKTSQNHCRKQRINNRHVCAYAYIIVSVVCMCVRVCVHVNIICTQIL